MEKATAYNGETVSFSGVEVKDSGLSAERIANIVSRLNSQFAGKNVIFVTEQPQDGEYSTVYIGRSSSFDAYGNFSGLAETIDHGNLKKDDNAFVFLDSSDSDERIISTISHEVGHLIGELDHGGDGLAAYAAYTEISGGRTSNGLYIYPGDTVNVFDNGTFSNSMVNGVLKVQGGDVRSIPAFSKVGTLTSK